MVLLAWLFALVSGVANACLLETSSTHVHVVAAASDATHVSTVMAGHTGAVADHGDKSPPAKAQCLKVCDESSNALSSQRSRALADMAPAPLVKVIWLVAATDPVTPSPPTESWPTITTLPLRLRYSRLAL